MNYTDLDIKFSIDTINISALKISFDRITSPYPSHSHSKDSYEIHYIPFGYGRLLSQGTEYNIKPNTLYITGPHIDHEQIPDKEDPMVEYCIYLKFDKPQSENSNKNKKSMKSNPNSVLAIFETKRFWFGDDKQDIHLLMKKIFYELEMKYTGYILNVQTLLQQLIVFVVRNYEINKTSSSHFDPSNINDSKYLMIEESFLYEYQTITLEKLSTRLSLSNRQTERLLQKYYGKTFLQKKADSKMSSASILLRNTTKSISSIACDLGYSSVEHFSNAFRRYYHMSASEYRRVK
jgi:AraC-like DNA-binding protein